MKRTAYDSLIKMPEPCRWYRDPDCPSGRYLVPGCWSRAVHGDDAACHCEFRRPVCQTCGQEVRHV